GPQGHPGIKIAIGGVRSSADLSATAQQGSEPVQVVKLIGGELLPVAVAAVVNEVRLRDDDQPRRGNVGDEAFGNHSAMLDTVARARASRDCQRFKIEEKL